jgi:hypothetical protein
MGRGNETLISRRRLPNTPQKPDLDLTEDRDP